MSGMVLYSIEYDMKMYLSWQISFTHFFWSVSSARFREPIYSISRKLDKKLQMMISESPPRDIVHEEE